MFNMNKTKIQIQITKNSSRMNQGKQKQIDISVSRITNWPDSESEIKFQISFYSKKDSILILSKTVKGKYSRQTKTMKLNSLMRIKYVSKENTVILRLAYRMGFAGQIILGDFTINFQNLIQKRQIKFNLDQVKSQYLIVEQYIVKPNKQDKNGQIKLLEENYGIEHYKGSKNEDFIKKRQDFLENHSNRSRRSSNLSNGNNLFTSRINELLSQVKNCKENKNMKLHNNFSPFVQSKNNISRQSNRSQNKDLRKPMERNHIEKSQKHSQRTNASSQKYILLVNNLNIVPCDEYYETKIKQAVVNRGSRNFEKSPPHQYNGYSYKQSKRQERQQCFNNKWNQEKKYSQYY